MAFNLLKQYNTLLEVGHLDESARLRSLRAVFDRDIVDNSSFCFRDKVIRPIKKEGMIDMDVLFKHLTFRTDKVKENKKSKSVSREVFDHDRSVRLHWIRFHIEERLADKIHVFSHLDRIPDRGNVLRTYLYDEEEKYIIILELQRSGQDYYFISAYYLSESWSLKQIEQKMANRIMDVL